MSAASPTDALHNTLAYISDQLPHLTEERPEQAEYVGRRVDQSMRGLEWEITAWLDTRYQDAVGHEDSLQDIVEVLQRANDLPPIDAPLIEDQQAQIAARHLDAVGRLLVGMIEPLGRDDVREVSIAMHLVRRSYSAYRVAKYRWLETELEADRYAPQAAYRWLET